MPGPDTASANLPLLSPAATGRRRRPWPVVLLAGGLAGLLLAALGETVHVMLGRNFHTVVPGRVYRCAQPTPAELERVIRQYGIRTVVNLRGCSAPLPWYVEESRVTHRLDVSQEDIAFSASRLPSPQEVRRLLQVVDHTEYPILLHCRQGADRTGLAAAIIMLLQPGADPDRALGQLGLRYGHVAGGLAAHLDRFGRLYKDWLASKSLSHSTALFRQWLEQDYCPGECRCRLEVLEAPARIPCGEPARLRFRAHNTSVRPWSFRPENNIGIHLAFVLKDEEDRGVTCGRSGLVDAVVPPGDSIDLTLALPGVKRPGHYRLLVDLTDERHCWFFQVGSEPLEQDLEIHD